MVKLSCVVGAMCSKCSELSIQMFRANVIYSVINCDLNHNQYSPDQCESVSSVLITTHTVWTLFVVKLRVCPIYKYTLESGTKSTSREWDEENISKCLTQYWLTTGFQHRKHSNPQTIYWRKKSRITHKKLKSTTTHASMALFFCWPFLNGSNDDGLLGYFCLLIWHKLVFSGSNNHSSWNRMIFLCVIHKAHTTWCA